MLGKYTLTSKITILFALLLLLVQARKIQTEIMLPQMRKNGNWAFIDRMTFEPGSLHIPLVVEIMAVRKEGNDHHGIKLELIIVDDDNWLTVLNEKCDQNRRDNKIIHPLKFDEIEKLVSRTHINLNVEKTTSYNFILRDCEKSLKSFSRRDSRIKLFMMMKNGDKVVGKEEEFYSYFLPLILATSIFLLIKIVGKKEQKSWTEFVLFFAICSDLLSNFLYYLGYLIYTLKSEHFYQFFDFTYLFFHSLSQAILYGLILLISHGWSITSLHTENRRKKLQFDLFIPMSKIFVYVVAMFGIMNIMLTMLSKIPDWSGKKSHMYDTIPSYILIIMRLFSLIGFFYGIYCQIYPQKSTNKSKKRTKTKDTKLITYLQYLGIAGTFFFISLPFIVFICEQFTLTYRKHYAFAIVQICKKLMITWLCWTTLSKKSMYRKIASDERSFMEIDEKQL